MKKQKWLKKTAAMLLAGTMLCGTAVWTGAGFTETVKAADTTIGQTPTTGKLTINKTDSIGTPLAGATFKIYKVINLTPGNTPGDFVKYEKVSAFENILAGVNKDDLDNFSAQQIENLAASLATEAAKLEKNGKIGADGTSVTADATGQAVFDNLSLGYYLVVETEAPEGGYVTGKPFLIALPSTNNYNNPTQPGTAWVYEVEASPKNSKTPLEKEINTTAPGNEVSKDGSVKLGDIVPYKITTTIPDYSDGSYKDTVVKFVVTDEMSSGLEIQNTTPHVVTVKVDGKEVTASDTTYTLTATHQSEAGVADLKVDFNSEYIKKNFGKDVEITYYAKVTDAAVMGQTGNTNKVELEITNNPGGTTEVIPGPTVKVYSFGLKVVKFTKDGKQMPLQGAEFELHKDRADGDLIGTTQTTKADGTLSFDRLDEGIYYLKETKAPNGYTLLANPIKVEIKALETEGGLANGGFELYINDKQITNTEGDYQSTIDQATGIAQVAVENHKGFNIPMTGGMGIALFLAVGAAGIVIVSVLLVKKSKEAK